MKPFVLLFCLAAGFLFFKTLLSHSPVNIPKALSTLPKDDRDALEWLFLDLNFSGCSYVLFGNKPMSFSSFLEREANSSQVAPMNELRDLSNRLCVQNLKVNKGWEAWKKYKDRFPSSRFIILENRNSEYVTIFMINKYNFLKKTEENIDLFRELLGSHITPSIVLENCLKSSNIIQDVLKNHDGLLGILLGFGRHNAQLFSRKAQIERENSLCKLPLSQNSLIPSNGFSTTEEEYRYISNTLKYFNEIDTPDFNPLLIHLPAFMADHSHPETQQLKHEYNKQYKAIISSYKKGNFLETTLKQFCR